MKKVKKKKKSAISRIISWLDDRKEKRDEKKDKEYSKRLLTKIINCSLLMMWMSYVLAFLGKIDIAESLSKTIVTAIIAVVIPYLIKSVIENISKHTNMFGENIDIPMVTHEEVYEEEPLNLDRDC